MRDPRAGRPSVGERPLNVPPPLFSLQHREGLQLRELPSQAPAVKRHHRRSVAQMGGQLCTCSQRHHLVSASISGMTFSNSHSHFTAPFPPSLSPKVKCYLYSLCHYCTAAEPLERIPARSGHETRWKSIDLHLFEESGREKNEREARAQLYF